MVRMRRIALAAVLGLLLSSCSATQEEPSILGVWISENDGYAVLEFHDDGTVVYSAGDSRDAVEVADRGEYTFEGGVLTYGVDEYCHSLGIDTGTYTVTVEGDTNTLTVRSDECQDRVNAIAAGNPWTRETEPAETTPAEGGSSAAGEPITGSVPWWNEDVFYEVFVRSFQDSGTDGMGDLRGLVERLDYLNDGDPTTGTDLGVTGLWLMPVTESPSYHGYDATDYFSVEQDYGTNQDFKDLIAAAHERGMTVIVDLMLNHTSSEHPWFIDSASGPDSLKRDWYVWRDDDPGQTTAWGSSAWHPYNGAYYLGLFWERAPDLNYRTPAVTDQMYDVAAFWLQDMGADGLRLDAVRHLIEEGDNFDGGPATHAWLAAWDDHIDSIDDQLLTVGEVWDDTATIEEYVTGDEVDIAFEFNVAQGILDSVRSGDPVAFDAALAEALEAFPAGQFAPFLTNHDQDRVMSVLGGDIAGAKVAASALLTIPGVPFIYYGEEIGMTGQKPDERIRTPMQWTADGSGFTTGTPWEPANDDADAVNVAAQQNDPASLLTHYRTLIGARTALPALQTGGLQALASTCPAVYAFLRPAADPSDDSALVVLNFSDAEQSGCTLSVDGSPLASGSYDVTDVLSGQAGAALDIGTGGSIDDYVPLDSIDGRGTAILQLSLAEEP
jgi:alpha-amylase